MADNNERMQAVIEAVATATAVGTHEQIKFLVGEDEKNLGHTGEVNVYTQLIDEAEGLEKIENLQSHENNEIYEKISYKVARIAADGAPQLISEIKQFLINLFQNSAETIEIKRIQRIYDELIESEIACRLDRYDASEKELRKNYVDGFVFRTVAFWLEKKEDPIDMLVLSSGLCIHDDRTLETIVPVGMMKMDGTST
ncbi:hypothetical protein POM88_005522 [Heracleum sosnowskyi]|uniref:Uncharacterized protein n=1 Tax=Heracleum sosnowskyi TaxID=360622 RepID=A0AAD8N3U6_9APIA|nr:hypothetical protein POM88_005522 [Heracleum sosnowskyi]